jgi:hypothetical protein
VEFGEFSSGRGQQDLLEDGGMDHSTPCRYDPLRGLDVSQTASP